MDNLCELARVSPAGYYRHLHHVEPQARDMELRDQIQRICIAHPRYGYRRVKAQLARKGLAVNHKKLRRLMRMDNLLAIRKRKWITTTDSRHHLSVFPNLARMMDPDGPDQLWVADITYIRLGSEFVYFAVILDAWSRRVIGWTLGRELSTGLAREALQQAIRERSPAPGLIHHSDRGAQYASLEYLMVLQDWQIIASMSRTAYPYDNAVCESFLKTLKQEEIYCRKWNTLEELRAALSEFIEHYYNQQRLHSALGYQTPEEFEAGRVA